MEAKSESMGSIMFVVFETGRLANGGVESVTLLIEGLQECRRTIFSNSSSRNIDRWMASGARVIKWRFPDVMGVSFWTGSVRSVALRVWFAFAGNAWVFLQAWKGQCDVLHCNDPAPFWYCALGARLAGKPVILNLRDTKREWGKADLVRFGRRCVLANRILVLSREMLEFYQRWVRLLGLRGSKRLYYCYSAVDLARMRPLGERVRGNLRRELGINEEEVAIVYAATICKKKNQLEYIQRVVPKIADSGLRTYFLGDFEPLIDGYAAQCLDASKGYENCARFAGYRVDIEKWFQACDMVVVPTQHEGLARCMIEGMACGAPIVSFDVCSAREMLEDNGCGMVVKQGEYEALADALRYLSKERDLRQSLGARGAEVAARLFARERILQTYREIYGGMGLSGE